jgi:DNA-directed RNA polymerase subunit alpha
MSVTQIKMPEAVVLDESSFSNTFGRFILQPLERGYGTTLGNSLRRVYYHHSREQQLSL